MRSIPFILSLLSLGCFSQPSEPMEGVTSNPTVAVLSEVSTNRFTTGSQYLRVKVEDEANDSGIIRCSLSWKGSWREDEAYDAAWVFFKYQNPERAWRHLNLNGADIRVIQVRSEDGIQPTLRVSPGGEGFMIYRSENGDGDNDWLIEISPAENPSVAMESVKGFGLEMVHVPTGTFEAGTLKGELDRREVLTPGAGGAPYDPLFTYQAGAKSAYGGVYKVNSEAAIEIGPEDGNLYWIDANIPGTNTFSGIPEGRLGESFPKGYAGFYQMKYELSQKEYCDFLNTLSPLQQRARDFTDYKEFNRPISDYRNAIVKVDGQYSTSRPHRPCNFISWLDGLAYADWAGIRHMTELEFEKSCRGSEPAVYREYVWGVNEIEEKGNMQFSTSFFQSEVEDGSEVTDGNVHASMFSYRNFIDVCTPEGNFYDPYCSGCRGFTGGDGGRGPVRKGIFGVTSEGIRIRAGASFYGAMELGGNLQEPVVCIGHPSGRRFEGSHGDGELNEDGGFTNPDWQPVDGDFAFGGRGGCWKFHENHARTADRFKGLRTKENRRASHIGFRGVRSDW